jgi:hypothetical protein
MIKPKPFVVIQGESESKQGAGNWYERSLLFEDLPLEGLEVIWEASRNYPAGTEGTLILATNGGAVSDVAIDATVFPFRNSSIWLIVMGKWYVISKLIV